MDPRDSPIAVVANRDGPAVAIIVSPVLQAFRLISPSLPAGLLPGFLQPGSILNVDIFVHEVLPLECQIALCLALLRGSPFAARRQRGQLATQALRISRRLYNIHRWLCGCERIRRVSGVLTAVLAGVSGPPPVTHATRLGSAPFNLEVASMYNYIEFYSMGPSGPL